MFFEWKRRVLKFMKKFCHSSYPPLQQTTHTIRIWVANVAWKKGFGVIHCSSICKTFQNYAHFLLHLAPHTSHLVYILMIIILLHWIYRWANFLYSFFWLLNLYNHNDYYYYDYYRAKIANCLIRCAALAHFGFIHIPIRRFMPSHRSPAGLFFGLLISYIYTCKMYMHPLVSRFTWPTIREGKFFCSHTINVRGQAAQQAITFSQMLISNRWPNDTENREKGSPYTFFFNSVRLFTFHSSFLMEYQYFFFYKISLFSIHFHCFFYVVVLFYRLFLCLLFN